MGGWQEEVGIKLFFLDFFRWVLCTVLVSTGVLVLIVLLQYKYKPAHRTHHANCRNHNIINKLNYYINIILSSPFSFSILFLLSFLPSYSSFLLLLLLLLLLTILPYYYFFLLLNNYYFFLLLYYYYNILYVAIYARKTMFFLSRDKNAAQNMREREDICIEGHKQTRVEAEGEATFFLFW